MTLLPVKESAFQFMLAASVANLANRLVELTLTYLSDSIAVYSRLMELQRARVTIWPALFERVQPCRPFSFFFYFWEGGGRPNRVPRYIPDGRCRAAR